MTAKKAIERMTKKELVEIVNTTQQELEAERSRNGVDRKAELKLVKEKETVKNATETSVEDIIKTFRVQINGALSGFEGQLLEKKQKLDEIQSAIVIEQQRMEDVYRISHKADTLEALLRAHEKEKEEHEALVKKIKEEWDKEQESHLNFVKEREALTNKEWNRKLEEHNYEWNQKIAHEVDKFKQEKKFKQRELKELEDATNDVLALKSEKTSRHFEVSTLKKNHEAEITVLTNNNTTLTTRVAELTKQNSELTAKLEEAYTKNVGLAQEAIQASAQAKVYVTNESSKGSPSGK